MENFVCHLFPRSDSIMSRRGIHWHFPRPQSLTGERRHTAQPPDSRSDAINIARGLIRSLDLNLWPGVRQGQGQEGMGQVAEFQKIIAPVKHSHWHYDIRAHQFWHRYFWKTTSTAFLQIQTSLNCRSGYSKVAILKFRIIRNSTAITCLSIAVALHISQQYLSRSLHLPYPLLRLENI